MALIRSVSGVRGIVRADDPRRITLSPDIARRLGSVYAAYLRESNPDRRSVEMIGGRDGRPTGRAILSAFIEGAADHGVVVHDFGIVTTPGLALAVIATGRQGGVMITASHNPGEWNGVKMMTAAGQAPDKETAEEIFRRFDDTAPAAELARSTPTANQPSTSDPLAHLLGFDPHGHHVDKVLAIVDVERIRARSFRVVLDSINGAGAKAGRILLGRLGCRLTHLNAKPADDFAHTPEPIEENLRDLAQQVRTIGADVGFAQDPDADRVAVIDETGRFIGEEYSLVLAARRVFDTRLGSAATNLSTSRMIDDVAARLDPPRTVHRSAVGEANVVQAMRAHHCVIGGEGNGGVIDPRVVHVRDSLVGIALVLDLIAAEDKPLSRIVAALPRYAMIKKKLSLDADRIPRILDALRDAFPAGRCNDLDGLRIDLSAEKRWLHVRASNTEPIVRIIAEAPDQDGAQSLIDTAQSLIQAD